MTDTARREPSTGTIRKEAIPIPAVGRPGGGPMGGRVQVEKPQNAKKTLFRLLSYLGKSRLLLLALLFLMLVITLIDIMGPLFQQKAIDTISVNSGALTVDFVRMRFYLAAMLLLFLVSGALTYLQGIMSAKLSQAAVYRMRGDLFRKLSKLPIRYLDTHRHGDLMSRMTNDVENVSNAIAQSITVLFSSVLTLFGAFGMMLYYSRILALIAVITVPITIVISARLGKFMQKYFKQQQRLLGSLNGQVEEMVIGYRTVVAYGKEEDAMEEFSETADKLRLASILARVWGAVMGPIMNFLGNFQYVLLASVGGFLILSGSGLTIGSIQAMLQYSKKFSQPVNMIANQYSILLTALAGAERVFEVLEQPDEIDEGTSAFSVADIRGEIHFNHLQFGYTPEKMVLKSLSLSVRAGQKIAIVGATGSGKTTIVNLLTRFYELNGGKITIDGVDITAIPKHNLRESIAIVLQDTVLFHDTIGSNIRYGNQEANDEAVKRAARIAMADQFIERLPGGYETMLSEGGSNLSQGQRQLLSIARAVLADPKILILDEATSSVDTRTEMQIQQAMINLMKNRTSLIIAHRLSTIRDADKIVVIHDGSIVEAGKHEELLMRKGEYYHLYSRQFAGVTT